jgi:hypothetical protein
MLWSSLRITTSSRRLSLAVACSCLVFLAAALIPPMQRSAEARERIELYRSDGFGYFFFYDASRWQTVDRSSGGGSDSVRFSDGATIVNYTATYDPDTTLARCVEGHLAWLTSNPGVLAVEALSAEGGPPQVHEGGSSTFAQIVVTGTGEDGQFKVAISEDCKWLEPEQTILHTQVFVPAAIFNENPRFEEPWLVGIRSGIIWAYRSDGMLIPSGAQVPFATASGATGAIAANLCFPRGLSVVVQNLGDVDLLVDASKFLVRENATQEGAQLEPVMSLGWSYPHRLPADESKLTLGAGDIGLLELDLPDPNGSFELYYAPADAQPVYVGTNVQPCGGGAAGAPVLIDLDE